MADSGRFGMARTCSGRRARLVVWGEVDLATVEALEAELRRISAQRSELTLDLSSVSFIDVRGARIVVDAVTAARRRGRRLEVSDNIAPQVRRLFELLELPLSG